MLVIKNIIIDGFGAFREREFKTNGRQFVLMTGINEAGKSTCFSFIRGVISGFRSQRVKENHYIPKQGGKHGGAIIASFGHEDFRIERYSKDKEFKLESNGSISAEIFQKLDQLGIDQYRAIFAFDLDELRNLAVLDSTELNEKLFSSTLSGSTDLVSESLTEIRETYQSYYRARSGSLLEATCLDLEREKENLHKMEIEIGEGSVWKNMLKDLESELSDLQKGKIIILEKIKLLDKAIVESRLKLELSKIESKIANYMGIVGPDSKDIDAAKIQLSKISDVETKISNLNNSVKAQELEQKKMRVRSALQLFDHRKTFNQNIMAIRLDQERLESSKKNILTYLICIVFSVLLLFFFDRRALFVLLLVIPLLAKIYRLLKNFQLTSSLLGNEIGNLNKIDKDLQRFFDGEVKTEDDLRDQLSSIEKLIHKSETIEFQRSALNSELSTAKQSLNSIYQKYRVQGLLEFEKLIEDSEVLRKLIEEREEFQRIANVQGFNLYLNDDGRRAVGDLESDLSDTQELLSELDIRADTIKNEISKSRAKFEDLSCSNDYEMKQQEVTTLQEEANRFYQKWQVGIVAERVLNAAVAKLFASKYSEVINKASDFFSKMTENNYREISLGENEKDLLVVTNQGQRVMVSELSRGTKEQLYLSMRLGLAVCYGKKFISLPILFDDILVNFDESRARQTLCVLKEISLTHQIFLFTCHNWVKGLVREVFADDYAEINI